MRGSPPTGRIVDPEVLDYQVTCIRLESASRAVRSRPMRIESTSFTDADYDAIVEGYFERERRQLLERLRSLPDQVDELVPALQGASRSDEQSWNAIETLAHMSIGVQFFGWAIHEVSSGEDV